MTNPMRILIVEDSADDAELTLLELSRDGLAPDWKRVETAAETRAALADGPWDAVLSDFSLPGFGAAEALTLCRQTDPDLPFIVVSGTIGEQRAVEMMRAGAGDYLLKGNLRRLSAAVEREVREAEGRRARKRTEVAMRASETRYRRLFEAAQDGILIVDAASRQMLDANPFLTELLGYSREELVGKELWEIGLFQDIAASKAAFRTLQEQGYIRYEHLPLVTKDGRQIQVEFVTNTYDAGDAQVIQCNIRDVTEREALLRHVQAERERLSNVFEQAPSFMCVLRGPEHVFERANDRYMQLVGHRDILGKPVRDALPEVEGQGFLKLLDDVYRTGEPFVGTAMRVLLSQRTDQPPEERYIDFVYQALHDPGGATTGVVVVGVDMTDRQNSEVRLRASEARFRAVFESDMLPTFFWQEEGLITEANNSFLELVGFTRNDLQAGELSWVAMTPPECRVRDLQALAEIDNIGRCRPYEKNYLRKDGSRVPILLGAASLNGGGKGVAFAIDQTERNRAQAALQRSEQRFRTLIAATTAIVWSSSPSGKFDDANQPAWTAFTAQTVDQYREWGWLDVIHPDDREKSGRAWAVAVATKGEYQVEHRIRRADGVYRHMTVRAVPILGPDGAILEWVGVHTDVHEHRLAETKIRQREKHLAAIIDNSPDCIKVVSPDGTVLEMNAAGLAMVEATSPEQVIGKSVFGALTPEFLERYQALHNAVCLGRPQNLTYEIVGLHGRHRAIHSVAVPLVLEDGRTVHLGIARDITEARLLEEQFRQAQKIHAFGQLAGGVAHDFNNLLTIINGYSDMLLGSLPKSDPSRGMIAEIHKAGERSAGLTRQLLAFSRQQVLAPRILDLNEVVADTDKMLRRLIGEDIRLTTTLETQPWAVLADPGQVEQVLLNLTMNARDAMPKGGRLTIETKNVELDESYVRTHKDARIGGHVVLSVTDSGSGIPPAVLAKIFEPFFTTKEPGKGTGLGLATVYGIVKQSGGHVAVYSEVGVGTTFKVYLPQAVQASERVKAPSRIVAPPRGTETILLAEDEAGVRTLTRTILTGCGYRVLEAADGDEAVRAAAGYGGPIHLLVTDVVMPGTGGRAVAEQLTEQYPRMRVIYVSGYTDDAVIRHGVLREGVNFLQKPFTSAALARKVRDVLDGTA